MNRTFHSRISYHKGKCHQTCLIYDVSRRLMSNNVSQFISAVMQQVYFLVNIDYCLTLAYQPINKNIRKAFKDYSDKLWKEKLEDLQIDDESFWNLTKNFISSKTKIPYLNSTISTAITDLDKTELIAQKLEKQFQLNPISDPVHENTVMQTINNFYQNNSDDIIPPASSDITIIKNTKIKSAPGLDSISKQNLEKTSHYHYHQTLSHQ
ncbi:hypothetical protein CDAR_23141 [Caerostris darwini]|uniref:Uncharacterized protein n=1 Tax=Caerostris darwini TaxID=1538125 RepID=A0AAV4QBV8_9ARAC|nr:hypothetical protein CDAR_23141 [Caerostris darwini]